MLYLDPGKTTLMESPNQNQFHRGLNQNAALMGNFSLLSSSEHASSISNSSTTSSVDNSLDEGCCPKKTPSQMDSAHGTWFTSTEYAPASKSYYPVREEGQLYAVATSQSSSCQQLSSQNPLETLVNLTNSQVTSSFYSNQGASETYESRLMNAGTPEFPPLLLENGQSSTNRSYDPSAFNPSPSTVRECVSCGVVSASVWRYDTTGHFLCNSCTYLSKNQSAMHAGGHLPSGETGGGQDLLLYKPSKETMNKALQGREKPFISSGCLSPSSNASSNNKRPAFKRTGLICSNCETNQTTLWRRNIDAQPVCNACGLYQKLHGRCRPVTMRKDAIQTRKRKSKKRRELSSTSISLFVEDKVNESDVRLKQSMTTSSLSKDPMNSNFFCRNNSEYNWNSIGDKKNDYESTYKSQFSSWSSSLNGYYTSPAASNPPGPLSDFDSIKSLSNMFNQSIMNDSYNGSVNGPSSLHYNPGNKS